eukprot:975572-Pelagomonas_calceolata.AAC.3
MAQLARAACAVVLTGSNHLRKQTDSPSWTTVHGPSTQASTLPLTSTETAPRCGGVVGAVTGGAGADEDGGGGAEWVCAAVEDGEEEFAADVAAACAAAAAAVGGRAWAAAAAAAAAGRVAMGFGVAPLPASA